jgi:hypothetical protein
LPVRRTVGMYKIGTSPQQPPSRGSSSLQSLCFRHLPQTYILHPVHMAKKFSHGRGGAGNICVDNTEYVDGLAYSPPVLSVTCLPCQLTNLLLGIQHLALHHWPRRRRKYPQIRCQSSPHCTRCARRARPTTQCDLRGARRSR